MLTSDLRASYVKVFSCSLSGILQPLKIYALQVPITTLQFRRSRLVIKHALHQNIYF